MRKASKLTALLTAIMMMASFLMFTACDDGSTVIPEPTQAEQDAGVFIALVDALPVNIAATSAHNVLITAAEDSYTGLSDDAKAVEGVSAAYAKLQQKRTAYNTANAVLLLANAKASAISELENYVDAGDYTINGSDLTLAIFQGKAAINGATTIVAVETALSNAKTVIDGIRTDEEEAALASTIVEIKITAQPTKLAYIAGQTFDKTGMVVKATFADESTNDDFTAYVCSPGASTPLTVSDTTIKVYAIGHEDIFDEVAITVTPVSPLPTPSAAVFNINNANPSTYAFEIDRDAAQRTSSIGNFDHLKIYVYDAIDATEAVTTFKIEFNYSAPSFIMTSANNTVREITKTGAYQYISAENFYLQRADAVDFMKEAIGSGFDYGNSYYFKAQFIAQTGSSSLDSALSALSREWIATHFSVSFNVDGKGNAIAQQLIASGRKATRPATDPADANFDFLGWYTDSGFGTEFNFDAPILANAIVYAKWESKGGPIVKTKLPTVTATAGGTNFMANGSGLNPKAFTYNRGGSAILLADWGTKVDHVLVTVYSSQTVKEGNQLLQFKITSPKPASSTPTTDNALGLTNTEAGMLLSSLDGSITHLAAPKTDSGYTSNTTNAFAVARYFSLFVNMIRAKDGNAAISTGSKLYFSFQLKAVAGSELFEDGDDSDICVNDDGRTFSIVSQSDAETGLYDLGGTNTAATNTAILVYDTGDGGTVIPNYYMHVGANTYDGFVSGVIPANPTRAGYTFAGWKYYGAQYADKSGITNPPAEGSIVNLSTLKINANMKLLKTGTVRFVAEWTPNP